MNLQETIRRILREDRKDLTPFIENMLNDVFVKNNENILCGVKVVHPDNRESLPNAFGNNIKFTRYEVTFIFIGGYGTKYWPKTMAIRDKYETIMNGAWDLVHDTVGQSIDIYSTEVKKCD